MWVHGHHVVLGEHSPGSEVWAHDELGWRRRSPELAVGEAEPPSLPELPEDVPGMLAVREGDGSITRYGPKEWTAVSYLPGAHAYREGEDDPSCVVCHPAKE